MGYAYEGMGARWTRTSATCAARSNAARTNPALIQTVSGSATAWQESPREPPVGPPQPDDERRALPGVFHPVSFNRSRTRSPGWRPAPSPARDTKIRAEAPPDEITRRLFLWMGFSIAIGLAGGVVISRVISSPISELAKAAHRIGRGDLVCASLFAAAWRSSNSPEHSTAWRLTLSAPKPCAAT